MQHNVVRFGAATYFVDAATAAEIGRLRRHDPAAAVALARRAHRSGGAVVPDGGSVSVSLTLMDAAQRSAIEDVIKELTMGSERKIVTIGDDTFETDARAAEAIQSLQGQNAAIVATLRSGGTLGDRAGTAADPQHSITDAARAAVIAQDRTKHDPETARGAYVRRITNAWRTTDAGQS